MRLAAFRRCRGDERRLPPNTAATAPLCVRRGLAREASLARGLTLATDSQAQGEPALPPVQRFPRPSRIPG